MHQTGGCPASGIGGSSGNIFDVSVSISWATLRALAGRQACTQRAQRAHAQRRASHATCGVDRRVGLDDPGPCRRGGRHYRRAWRVIAAHRLGIEDVPVMVAAGWSDAKKRAYMLADNKLTLNGEWDFDRLAIEIAELRANPILTFR